jgi:hypothetical protein
VNYRKVYLWLSALGLVPVALSYGVAPVESLNWLFGMTVEVPNQAHIFRGIMGLYLGMVLLWIMGAMNESCERPAIIAEVFFMSGLAVGRLLSVVVDGVLIGCCWDTLSSRLCRPLPDLPCSDKRVPEQQWSVMAEP